jgi:hypothetical protein
MSKTPQASKPPVRTISDEAREASLDMAAAALAAIHTSKQVAAELPRPGARSRVLPDQSSLPFGIGDILFGAAQLQVDFARRLLEFNRGASTLLRERLRENRQKDSVVEVRATTPNSSLDVPVSIRNRSRFARQFTFAGSESYLVEPASLTVAGGESGEVLVRFMRLARGVNQGHISVLSRGISVERIPYEIEVTATDARRPR